MIKTIGEHKVRSGSIMNGIGDLMSGKKADIFFSDPPWGQGNLGYWNTMKKKQTGSGVNDVDNEDFLKKFFETVHRYAKGIVLVYYGVKYREDFARLAVKSGLINRGLVTVGYKGDGKVYPMDLHIFSKSKGVRVPSEFAKSLRGKYSGDLAEAIVAPFAVKDGILLDPCCGQGTMAYAAIQNGMKFRGNELNEKRAKDTSERIEGLVKRSGNNDEDKDKEE